MRTAFRRVQIKSPGPQIIPPTLIFFSAQQVLHQPVAPGQIANGQRNKTLAAMRREVHGHQIKAIRLQLPLHDYKILRRGIVRPGRARPQDFAIPSSHSAGFEHVEQMLVEGLDLRLRRFDGEYRWFLFRTGPSIDASGQVVKWYGMNIDIDARRRAEEPLHAPWWLRSSCRPAGCR